MVNPLLSSLIVCAALLSSLPKATSAENTFGAWTLSCAPEAGTCRLAQKSVSRAHPQTMYGTFAMYRGDRDLNFSVITPPLLFPVVRFQLQPSGQEMTARGTCTEKRCEFEIVIRASALDNMLNSTEIHVFSTNPLGGEEQLTADLTGLKRALDRLPHDL